MNTIDIGVDVGNYDTKTQHCKIASGYHKYNTKPLIATQILSYDGAYYVPDVSERMPYVVDKTQNDQCLILTLFGIAEEMLHIAKEAAKNGQSNTQVELDKIRHIRLGVGLPPGHFSKYAEKTKSYYINKFYQKEVRMSYKNYNFCFTTDEIRVLPQDFVAVYSNPNCETRKMKRYYIIGIGGGTTDVIPVYAGKVDANYCFSLELGTRVMYRRICADIQRQYGVMLDENLVEDVLKGEETALKEEIKAVVRDDAKLHFNDIINGCIQQGVKLDLYPTVFFGGGALLFKHEIENNEKITSPEIIADINANAKAYAACLG